MSATRQTRRVALVTCTDLPGLPPDDQLVIGPLAARGVAAEPAVWDDPGVDWAAYDLVVPRSTWDYPNRRTEFIAWADRVPRLANPAPVIRWNTDKRYLDALARAGVPVVETRWLDGPGWVLPASGEYVLKPVIGAGGVDSGRYDLSDPAHRRLAAELIGRVHAAGRAMMVQPYLPAVDTDGETALLYLGGAYSHAIRKGPLLTGPDYGVDGLYRPEDISPREATAAERAVGEAALAAVPGADLLYARVDLIPDAAGRPLLVEFELTEPSLFLGYAPGAADRFADAITFRVPS